MRRAFSRRGGSNGRPLRDRALAINGVSKTYAMTGWCHDRLAHRLGRRTRGHRGAINTMLPQSSGNCCSVSQAAAAAALNGDQGFVAAGVQTYRMRRDAVLALINAIPGLRCSPPDGAFYLYVNCAGVLGGTTPSGTVLGTDGEVVMFLLDHAGVALVAGTAYGLSPYFRLSIATSLEVLQEGCARIAAAVAGLPWAQLLMLEPQRV